MPIRPAKRVLAAATALAVACGTVAAPPVHAETRVEDPHPPGTTVFKVAVPPGLRVINDPSIPHGETIEVMPGKEGEAQFSLIDATLVPTILTEPQPRVIRQGLKDSGFLDHNSYSEQTMYDVVLREMLEVAPGDTHVMRRGEFGIFAKSGDAVWHDDPRPMEIALGVGPSAQTLSEVTAQTLPFKVLLVEDDALKPDEAIVERPGELGLKTVTRTAPVSEGGKPQNWAAAKTATVKEPVSAVIRVGRRGEYVEVVAPVYSPVTAVAGQAVQISVANRADPRWEYQLDQAPEGWAAEVDPKTGTLTVTPPADAEPGTTADIQVHLDRGSEFRSEKAVARVTVSAKPAAPTPAQPEATSSQIHPVLVAVLSVVGTIAAIAGLAFAFPNQVQGILRR